MQLGEDPHEDHCYYHIPMMLLISAMVIIIIF